MEIKEIKAQKKNYIELLLLGDEQESMIDRYLERGILYVLEDYGVKAVCVITDEGEEILEIKNIAVKPADQRKGYGKRFIDFIIQKYKDQYRSLQVGTGESSVTISFYEKCGFHYSHKVKNFFIDHYDHPIYECGNRLIDMIYYRMDL